MIRKFYEKALPTQGVYCVTGIDTSGETPRAKNYFCESLPEVFETLDKVKAKKHNVFVALSSFDGHTRKAENAIYSRSFFIDLDVGEAKEYASKEEAQAALDKFLETSGLPSPNRVDSGRGIHAYWIFENDVTIEEWKPYAEKFKSYCLENGLHIDRAVTADAARILRAPDSYNYKENPPLETKLLDEEVSIYQFEDFKQFLGEDTQSLESIIQSLPKGELTDEERSLRKLDNFEHSFEQIAIRSLDGDGCAQIAEILRNPNGISYDMWVGGLTIAVKCNDGETAIHKMSEDYEDYSYDATVKKAYHSGLEGPRTCEWFAQEDPSKCEGCRHRGKIGTPLQLGKALKIASQPLEKFEETQGALRVQTQPITLPQALFPFVRGVNGGIYMTPPPTVDKKTGITTSSDPVLVSQYDLYPIRRVESAHDGATLIMRAHFPNDRTKEFVLPVKYLYAQDKFREILASNNVLFNPLGNGVTNLMYYVYKWGAYLTDTGSAEIMRHRMGWTEDHDAFIAGNTEIKPDGTTTYAPTSPICHNITKYIKTGGTFEAWKESANKLNTETLELHAFIMLCGFGSTLMNFTNTNGVTVALTGRTGGAKTGALYAALSIWGEPKGLSIATNEGATANALNHRYAILNTLPFGIDEIGNIRADTLASLVSRISFGSAKIKLQGSVNAEREVDAPASLIGIMTANGELYDKLKQLKANPEGEVARLIEFKLASDPPYLLAHPEKGAEIFDPFNYNYGWAGIEFIKLVYKYTDDDIRLMIAAWKEKFRALFGFYGPYRYYENLVGVAMTAGELLVRHGILVLDLDRIFQVVTLQMIQIKDNVVKAGYVDYESLLGEYINAHQANILMIKEGKVSMEPKGALYIRAVIDKSQLCIDQSAFNKFLAEKQVSTREFSANIKTAGINVEQKRMRMGTGWKDATGAFNVNAYVFDSTDFLKNIIDDESLA